MYKRLSLFGSVKVVIEYSPRSVGDHSWSGAISWGMHCGSSSGWWRSSNSITRQLRITDPRGFWNLVKKESLSQVGGLEEKIPNSFSCRRMSSRCYEWVRNH